MLSVITLRDLITAHAALDTLDLDQHVPVNRGTIHSFIPNVRESKTVLPDSTLWIQNSMYWIPDQFSDSNSLRNRQDCYLARTKKSHLEAKTREW